MRYIHRFRVKAPLSSVVAFHQQPSSMAAITPPPMMAEIHHAPESLANGGEVKFSLWLGPLPIHWTASIEEVSEAGFSDRQVNGPFSVWVHRHSFQRVDDQTTEVIDQIEMKFRAHPGWALVGLGFVMGLPALFAYRGWKTRRLLEKGSG